jgi:hypothetical protein
MLETPRETLRWPRAARAAALACALSVAIAAGLALRYRWVLDDAYITFAYARNLVRGDGLVFNRGERVEGYTSFSWVLASALGLALGADIETWSFALGALSLAGCVVGSFALVLALFEDAGAHSRTLRYGAAALASAWVAAYAPLAFWAASGMETALFTLLVVLSLRAYAESGAGSRSAPLLVALSAVTRPEGALLALVLAVHALRTAGLRGALSFFGRFLAPFAVYLLFRVGYYGQPLPNTFYAKVGGRLEQGLRGTRYLWSFVWTEGAFPLAVLAAAAPFTRRGRRAAAPAAFAAVYVAYVVAVGGDVFPASRFLVPLVPVLAALSAVTVGAGVARLANAAGSSPRRETQLLLATPLAAWALVALLWIPVFRATDRDHAFMTALFEMGRAPCADLRSRTKPGDSVAALGVGYLKFCTDLRVIDMLGLTDAHVARAPVPHFGEGCAGHERFDSRYVLGERPAYVLVPPPDASIGGCRPAAVRDLWKQPEIGHEYVPDPLGLRRVDAPPPGGAARP